MAKAPRKTAEFIDTAGNEIDTVNPNVVTLAYYREGDR